MIKSLSFIFYPLSFIFYLFIFYLLSFIFIFIDGDAGNQTIVTPVFCGTLEYLHRVHTVSNG